MGIVILPDQRWAEASRRWRRAEEYGFDSAWTYDHIGWRDLVDGPWFDAVSVLTAAALVTSRIRLGTLVASPNVRHPVPVEDRVILCSVAGLRSSIAYYRRQYASALSVFNAYPPDPPYLAARNAAYRARAHARLGNAVAAKAELELMNRSRDDRAAEPGDLPLNEAASWMFTAVTLAACGEGEKSEGYARRSVAAHGRARSPRRRSGRTHCPHWRRACCTTSTQSSTRLRPLRHKRST